MRLRDLLDPDARWEARHGDVPVTAVTADSRAATPGALFAAVPGTRADGLTYVPAALANGAVAVMAERAPATPLPDGVALVLVENVRAALARAAARLHARQPAVIAAVTGTSGKTSVASYTRQLWAALGHQAASIGTIGLVTPTEEHYGSLTTPDPVALHATLDRIAGEGVTHLALEASSHGIEQHRLDGVRVAVAGFTNITRDHLDYHLTFEAYLTAKLGLFERLLAPDGTAVIDIDHPHADAVLDAARARGVRILTVGRSSAADIRAAAEEIDGFSQTVTIVHAGRSARVRLPLVGAFQVDNALVAAGQVIATGGEPAAVFEQLEGLEGAKGRLELVGHRCGAPIFVDYAHKPDALAKTLDALRPYAKGQLVVVFGCGGDRDTGKRPLMGAIAAEKADRVIVTDDNPRSEDPTAIRAAILAAAPGAVEIGDRREAIRQAIDDLAEGDVLVVAGKGHETGQTIAGTTLPFSDHEAVTSVLREKTSAHREKSA
ncbi:UDP-N-acetylmuramoyl-L-alanyl-D-glutamate--2,6-diaminopimelate ligase [Rhodoplanes sp. TEM]|uniref:UDP-N-acetylmuramoyl-L-alanyl-D-glutamate--2,6-diaminopimelate ligase n=1 Tax=Rhodoplanes tepidamans TaxID=200616 RepID=A0ABT5J6Z6_RHOTP|nr:MULTISPECIES: UDP-N-acetylmuramoyl-L-alanyl-D-glutamate--2,6-diaminopimelate ligase [Rhodoplanes]MDC7785381.1 UDP-N-acetylmuramoyl-L-alanyl-D-glutamate--2,6-diaminopimelate ligase [Rhodoplanes tepidamans]MDC7984340.1 UDP-N-acetylmuramoyl-L-alanyl-D-glutamate--2,6-diaminopimelate ligase [Rhodoplanes sp. TEM]MDQ0353166.1 UDP-N-acetylmuramoyl-L-alanyl-D-glutamate--2,6-diaminopimelate ligase [Rhodoplanes tepidamans]